MDNVTCVCNEIAQIQKSELAGFKVREDTLTLQMGLCSRPQTIHFFYLVNLRLVFELSKIEFD